MADFLPEIYGRRLICYSDHRAIVDAFKRQDVKQNDPVAARQMLEVSQFTSNIQHIFCIMIMLFCENVTGAK